MQGKPFAGVHPNCFTRLGGHMFRNLLAGKGQAAHPRTRVASLVIGALLAPLFAAPALAQCSTATLPGQPGAFYEITVEGACAFDPDGPGGEPTSILLAGTFGDFDGYRRNSIDQFLRTEWDSFALSGSIYEFTAISTWDPDASGSAPAVAVAAYRDVRDQRTQVATYRPRVLVGAAFDNLVKVLYSWDHDQNPDTPAILLAGGKFLASGGTPVPRLAYWTGTEWRPFAGGADGDILCMTSWDPDGPGPMGARLVIGGSFLRVGGDAGAGPNSIAASGLAAWNGESWESFPVQLASRYIPGLLDGKPIVQSVTSWDQDGPGPQAPRVAASGYFWNANNTAQKAVVITDAVSASWIDQVISSSLYAVASIDHDADPATPERLVMSDGRNITASIPSAVAIWDGHTIEGLGGPAGFTVSGQGAVRHIVDLPADEFGPGRTAFIGSFDTLNGFRQRYVAIWDGHRWSRVGPGYSSAINSTPRAFVTWDPDADGPRNTEVWAAGVEGVTSRGDLLKGISRWDGADWFPTGSDSFAQVNALILFDRDGEGPEPARPLAGGIEISPDGSQANFVRIFDGEEWSSLGTGLAHTPADLCTWEMTVNNLPTTVLVSVGEGNPAAQYLLDGEWRSIALPLPASPKAVAQVDFDGPGPEAPLLAIASHSPDASNIVRAFSDPQTSWSIGDQLRGNPDQAAINAGPMLTGDMFEWDPDGPGSYPPGLVIASSAVYAADGTPEFGLNMIQSEGSRVRLGVWSDSTATGDVAHAALWRVPGESVDRVVWSTGFTVVAYSLTQPRLSFWGGMNGPVGTWDVDGDGPRTPQLIHIGEWWDWYFGQRYAGGLTVVRGSPLPWIARTPTNTVADQSNTIQLSAAPAWGYAERDEGLQYQWRRDGVPIIDGPQGASPGGGIVSGASGTLLGSRDLTLTISNARRSDTGYYDLVLTNSCGSTTSAPAELYIEPACPADIDDSGTLNELDIARFLASFESGLTESDLDRSGGIDAADIAAFFDSYASGCP